jgi:hypothetical protein
MRKWLYERPWIWIVLFLGTLIAGSIATVIIAEVNKPEIVKPKAPRKARNGSPASQVMAVRWVDGSTGVGGRLNLARSGGCDKGATCAGASGGPKRGSTEAGCDSVPGLDVDGYSGASVM